MSEPIQQSIDDLENELQKKTEEINNLKTALKRKKLDEMLLNGGRSSLSRWPDRDAMTRAEDSASIKFQGPSQTLLLVMFEEWLHNSPDAAKLALDFLKSDHMPAALQLWEQFLERNDREPYVKCRDILTAMRSEEQQKLWLCRLFRHAIFQQNVRCSPTVVDREAAVRDARQEFSNRMVVNNGFVGCVLAAARINVNNDDVFDQAVAQVTDWRSKKRKL